MKPIGPLMWEHRLIERLMQALETQIHKIHAELTINRIFIDTAVDFIRTYADRTHHGKEEDILFRDLSKQTLSPEHRRIMQELVDEHGQARRMTQGLVEAKERFFHGDMKALDDIEQHLVGLTTFYPRHIEKEDKHFFFPCMEYLSPQAQESMLKEFWEFDRRMIHEKYQKVVGTLEALKAG
jgi:hemerythrin-like domain-containing protein